MGTPQAWGATVRRASFDNATEKSEVFFVGPVSDLREDTSAFLAQFYNFASFSTLTGVIRHDRSVDAAAIIVDARTAAAFEAVRVAWATAEFRRYRPKMIFLASSHAARVLTQAWGFDAARVFQSPLDHQRFLETLSSIASATVEDSWKSLPPLQRAVLQETAGVMRKCFGQVDSDEPLPVEDVERSCRPLVAAVESDQVREVLLGVRMHDDYTFVHSLRVSIYLSLLGHTMGLAGADMMTLATGGLLHDIGKAKIPIAILNKPGRLDEAEMVVMRSHVDHTRDILSRSPDISRGIMVIATQHHEKLDGTGYPAGLGGNELNDLARMTAIVDVFGALTDRRPYKPPMASTEAVKIMKGMSGHLDPHLLALFEQTLLRQAAVEGGAL